jgi:hypothetical protein
VFLARKIARELLPLVVIAWATFVILGGALEVVEHNSAGDNGSAAASGLGLCALSTALIMRVRSVWAVRPVLRIFVKEPARKTDGLLAAQRPEAYAEPPPNAPSLQQLQILRA